MPAVLITGASRGIGLELARTLASQGWTVLSTARTLEKAKAVGKEAEGTFVPLELNVESEESVVAAVQKTKDLSIKLDVLINNAGVFETGWSQELFERAMSVNLFGPVRVMRSFIPLLSDGARIINVSSGYGKLKHSSPAYRAAITACNTVDEVLSNITFNPDDEAMRETNHACYKISKACLNRATQIMAKDPELMDRGIKAFVCCPGWVRTSMGGPNATRSIPEGAASILALVHPAPEHTSGGFFRDGKPLDFE